ncbi:hypothetical protein OUZ56_008558 [Daphnia magna]|uniref:Uncharacterized protein n=1 Tax=Daphnia magna TaxID=35525 RepID=A0ABR0ADP9_9CRUS|nr:hypothetical protein OUZ56_008558 [Daphnia magna]
MATIISQCLRVAICVVLFSNSSWARSENDVPVLCPAVAPGIFGDLTQHYGCYLPGVDVLEDKMKPTRPSGMSRIKPGAIPQTPMWLKEFSSHLLNSTRLINNFLQAENPTLDDSDTECDGSCPSSPSWVPQCCRAETRLLYPMYGRSLTTDRLVPIAQELNPNGIQQPVVYRHCLSRNRWQSSLFSFRIIERKRRTFFRLSVHESSSHCSGFLENETKANDEGEGKFVVAVAAVL